MKETQSKEGVVRCRETRDKAKKREEKKEKKWRKAESSL